jgi:hypothetical protein
MIVILDFYHQFEKHVTFEIPVYVLTQGEMICTLHTSVYICFFNRLPYPR